MRNICLFIIIFFYHTGSAQNGGKIYPENWWIGMKDTHLQLLIHQSQIKFLSFDSNLHKAGISLNEIEYFGNPNYAVLNLTIAPNTKPGKLLLRFHNQKTHIQGLTDKEFSVQFDQVPKGNGTDYARGITAADFIYLLMPDRFSNGNPANDRFADMRDTVVDRKNPLARHGGDMEGVINHLDYFKQLGVTTLWLTPVIENDMPTEHEPSGMLSGYHGYWFTDQYEIDKRLGGREAYLKLVNSAHTRGLKMIQDAVYNHIGTEHWIMKDMPDSSWINHWPAYQNTSHREQTLFDIHASDNDRKIMEEGWFVPHLPDLNLRNPILATFLIQQAIWMTETFQLDGWRVDTYKYCDPEFLNNLNASLEKEFPKITSLGEATVSTVAAGAYFCKNNLDLPWKSNLTGILDFPVCDAMLEAVSKHTGWSDGVNRLYTTLAEDMLYRNPMNNCIFLDNHDRDRFYSVAGENFNNFKMGIGLLLTERGIPHLYYGTEILMKNFKNPSDAMVREDFPGGFAGDSANKFHAEGRTSAENAAFEYVSKLALFRKNSSAIKSGKLMHYIPDKSLYVYFRYDDQQTILCALNADTVSTMLDPRRFSERTKNFVKATDILSGSNYALSDLIPLPARSITILELKKKVD